MTDGAMERAAIAAQAAFDKAHAASNGRRSKPAARRAEHPGGPEPAPAVETFSAADLMRDDLPEPRCAVPGIVPEGLSLLAGKPKLGKSWLALNLAIATATGGTALGTIAVEAGDVLYLALEDTKRRLKDRLGKLLSRQQGQPPERLTLATSWPRQDQGGLLAVLEWLVDRPQARLVIIDTWPRFRPATQGREQPYEKDYRDAVELKALADGRRVAILAVAHCRKASALDPLEELSGTLGLVGGADAVQILRRERGRADATLHITGRDLEEQELALGLDPEFCLWTIAGPAEEFRISKERAELLRVVREAGRPVSPAEIASATGKKSGAVRYLLLRMEQQGQVLAIDRGKYVPAPNFTNTHNATNTPNSPNNGQLLGGHGRTPNNDSAPESPFRQ